MAEQPWQQSEQWHAELVAAIDLARKLSEPPTFTGILGFLADEGGEQR